MATEAVIATGGCLDLIETANAIHDFVKGKRRKAEVKAALASENVLPWPKAPNAS